MRRLVQGLLAVGVGLGTTGSGSGQTDEPAAATARADMIRVGNAALRPRLLAPGMHTIRSFKLEAGAETPVSRTTQTVEIMQLEGEEVYRVRTVHEAASDTTRTLTIVRRRDLSLVHQDVRGSRDSASVTVNGLRLTAWSVLPNTPLRLIDRQLARPVWPGNVRELENVIERAVIFCKETAIQDVDILLKKFEAPACRESFQKAKSRKIEEFEKSYIQGLLLAFDGNITRAANAAQKNRRAFYELIRKYKIEMQDFKPIQ